MEMITYKAMLLLGIPVFAALVGIAIKLFISKLDLHTGQLRDSSTLMHKETLRVLDDVKVDIKEIRRETQATGKQISAHIGDHARGVFGQGGG